MFYKKVVELFQVPEGFRPLVMAAIGYYGDSEKLPEEMKEREVAPRERKKLKEILFSGKFGESSLII